MNTPNRKTKEETRNFWFDFLKNKYSYGEGGLQAMINFWFTLDPDPASSVIAEALQAFHDQETSLSGNSAGVEKVKMFVSKTTSDSTFVRIVDGEKEYKVEVFDDTICLHVYKSGEKEGSYYENINPESPLPTPTNQSDAVGILKELVELKDMENVLNGVWLNSKEIETIKTKYIERSPLAWEAARKFLQDFKKFQEYRTLHPESTMKTFEQWQNWGA